MPACPSFVCVCVRACVRACVRVCVCVCVCVTTAIVKGLTLEERKNADACACIILFYICEWIDVVDFTCEG